MWGPDTMLSCWPPSLPQHLSSAPLAGGCGLGCHSPSLCSHVHAFTVLSTTHAWKPDPKAERGEVSHDGLSHTAGSRLLAKGVPCEMMAGFLPAIMCWHRGRPSPGVCLCLGLPGLLPRRGCVCPLEMACFVLPGVCDNSSIQWVQRGATFFQLSGSQQDVDSHSSCLS